MCSMSLGTVRRVDHHAGMDAIGFAWAAALVLGVFVVFERLVNALGDVVDAARWSVAPTVLGGLRAWGERASQAVPEAGGSDVDEADTAPPPGPGGTRNAEGAGRSDDRLVVPVTRVEPRRRILAAG
jgi:hypothetical protein